MVENVPLVTIFISSPSDVAEERAIAENSISRLNKTALHTQGLAVHALRSETDVHPGIGQDAQDVINQRLGDRYDILLGIMGARFGTPTPRAGSGTEEEFDRVLKRHESSPGSVEIMFYFKDGAVRRDKDSLLQAIRVEEFRERVQKAGVFYKTFKESRDFENLLNVDLPLCLHDRFSKATTEGKRAVAALPTVKDEDLPQTEEASDDDLGLLDYFDLFQDSMNRLGSFSSDVSVEMEKFNERTRMRTEELKLCNLSDGSLDIKKAKVTTNKAASDYEELAAILSNYIKMLSIESQRAVNALRGILTVAADFHQLGDKEKKRMVMGIEELLNAMKFSRESIGKFRETVERMPRVTGRFNKAKKNAVNVLTELANELQKTESMFSGVVGPISRL